MDNGYSFEDSRPYGGGDRGVMTPAERETLRLRREVAAAEAASGALARAIQQVEAIEADTSLTAQERLRQLRRLSPSGLSIEEDRYLRQVQGYE
jgi:hypothetical protein